MSLCILTTFQNGIGAIRFEACDYPTNQHGRGDVYLGHADKEFRVSANT